MNNDKDNQIATAMQFAIIKFVIDLENIERIGGDANFEDSQVQTLGRLKSIGGNAYFKKSQVNG